MSRKTLGITAKEARELAGPTVEERVADALEKVKESAQAKKRKVLLHGWWADAGYNTTADYKAAKKLLEAHGFTVEFFYQDGSQFANFYTIVKW